MSRKTAIIVLVSVIFVVGLSQVISAIPYVKLDPTSMPHGILQFKDQAMNDQAEKLYFSGYYWEVKDPASGGKVWDAAGPDNFFTQKYGVIEILPGDLRVTLEIAWLEPPETVIIRRWPISEWTPDDFEATHSKGEEVARSWETHWKKTDVGFDVERGSLYGIWVHYGDAWVEYSFIVPADDPTEYDYLGYIKGFENPKAMEFTLDPIEWIDSSQSERIKELNLNPDEDMPGGFYIYNPTVENKQIRFTDQTKYSIIDPETGNTQKTVEREEFMNYLTQLPDFGRMTPFWIIETNGDVEFIKEQYVP